ncbi:hypothetical protein NGE73_08495 [Bacillus cereus]|uniref:hypothetical protein n=1 Tax=Bacillus cereus TaxID=1396 RepID=UPI0011A524B2|nr:hypothetical protein [Bacillus cereus]MDE7542858.1 hypothetical protein [Bacillus cereus]
MINNLNKIKIKKGTMNYDKLESTSSSKNADKIQYNSIGQLITRARFEKKPLIVVEGVDDVTVYEIFAQNAKLNASIRAVETIPGYGEGCEHVKKFIENAQEEINNSPINEKFLLGIIDKDASYYRGVSISHLKCLLMLDVYSYESHFVTQGHVNHILNNILHSKSGVNTNVINYIMSDLQTIFNDLYYVSLEALKNACVTDYHGLLGYSHSYGQIKNTHDLIHDVLDKKPELDLYATSHKISFRDFKSVIKGKWLLESFIENIYSKISILSHNCKNNTLAHGQVRCHFCENKIYDKCSWRIRRHYPKNSLYNLLLQYIDPTETQYIIDRLKMLG